MRSNGVSDDIPEEFSPVFQLNQIQQAIRGFGFDGWLLYDFRGSNLLARRVLDLEQREVGSRRFLYFVPALGPPRKLVHRIESAALDHLPGDKQIYLRWQELESGIAQILAGARMVAMEYSPRGGNPYVSRVDAGTLELVRATGAEVASSGDLIQLFEAAWDEAQWDLHLQAAQHTQTAFETAYATIAEGIRHKGSIRESQVQQAILGHFRTHRLVASHPPIVAVGPHAGDPHYEITPATDAEIRNGDFVLIDLWAKLDEPRAVYSDLTQVGFVGRQAPARQAEVFRIVAEARDAAIECVRQAFAAKRPLRGWQVDQAARDVIESAGFGAQFVHRTGHSIGQETHGNGANMDNLETHEERLVLPRSCFSVEPGIYLPDFGVRSEVNVFVDSESAVHVTGGPPQAAIRPILTD